MKVTTVCFCLMLTSNVFAQLDPHTTTRRSTLPPAALDPSDVALTLESVGPAPRVYQALRLRARIKNVSHKRLGPIPELVCTRTVFRAPGETEWRNPDQIAWVPGYGAFAGAFDRKQEDVPLYLDPGEQMSLSWTVAVRFEYPLQKLGPPLREQLPIAHAIFSRAGRYQFKFAYQLSTTTPSKVLEKMIEVDALEPDATDAAIVDRLRGNPRLLAELLIPSFVPDVSWIQLLERLLQQSPSSSYADYLRFGLARAHLRRLEIMPSDQWDDDTRKEARAYHFRLLRDPQKDGEHLDALFFNRYLPQGPGTAQEESIRAMIESRRGPPEKQNTAVDKYLSLLFPSALDEAGGINQHYATIENDKFPYRDASLVLLRRVLIRRADPGADRLTELLNRDYWDAWIWLYANAPQISTAEWQALRVRDAKGAPSKPKLETLPSEKVPAESRNRL